MTTLTKALAGSSASSAIPADAGQDQLHISAVELVVGLGTVRAQVALSHWLVAVVQAPTGPGPADLHEAFKIGAGWPLASWPVGYQLLGYLDPNDLLTT